MLSISLTGWGIGAMAKKIERLTIKNDKNITNRFLSSY